MNDFLPATQAQINYLKKLNVQIPNNLTMKDADALIKQNIAAKPSQPATQSQINYLNILKVPYSQNITKLQAQELIRQAKENQDRHQEQQSVKEPCAQSDNSIVKRPEYKTLRELGINLKLDITLGQALQLLHSYLQQ